MLLLIDNYDSFTYNLARYFEELGQDVKVVKNDAITLPEIEMLSPDYLVISPGPGGPKNAGISLAAIKNNLGRIPLLGVCLGHQCLAEVLGSDICRAKEIRHGKTSSITHNNDNLFTSIPSPFQVTRYHSLVVNPLNLPSNLEVLASCCDEVMAIKHTSHYAYGVQFHPEALLSQHGHTLLSNFIEHAP